MERREKEQKKERRNNQRRECVCSRECMILFPHKIDIMKDRMYDRERNRRIEFMIERETAGHNV